MLRNLLLVFAVLLILSACQVGGASSLPTLIPKEYLPTVIALTAEALPTLTPPPTQEVPQPTLTFTPTVEIPTLAVETSLPDVVIQIPEAAIQIVRPGPLSKIVSPTLLSIYVIPGAERRATAELWGEDGRLIYRQIFTFITVNKHAQIYKEIGFETAGVAETGRLVVRSLDEYGRVIALSSVPLMLMASGEEDIFFINDVMTPILIQYPLENVLVQGNSLSVSGLARTGNDEPLLVELIAADGRVLGSRLAGFSSFEAGAHNPFSVDVPFGVDAPTWTRVTVSERSGDEISPVNISSVEVLLSP